MLQGHYSFKTKRKQAAFIKRSDFHNVSSFMALRSKANKLQFCIYLCSFFITTLHGMDILLPTVIRDAFFISVFPKIVPV
jgi:hypothetical protein